MDLNSIRVSKICSHIRWTLDLTCQVQVSHQEYIKMDKTSKGPHRYPKEKINHSCRDNTLNNSYSTISRFKTKVLSHSNTIRTFRDNTTLHKDLHFLISIRCQQVELYLMDNLSSVNQVVCNLDYTKVIQTSLLEWWDLEAVLRHTIRHHNRSIKVPIMIL